MKPKLFEALMQKDSEHKELYEKLREKAATHPFVKRYCEVGVKEGLFSDTVGALGRMHDTLVEAAYPELIGRNIINVKQTTEPLERFPLDEKAVAYAYAEGAVTRLSGKKHSTIDIQTNQLADASEEWTREFVEDATWNVMDNMLEKVGRALGENETTKILQLYAAIADADLAGGALWLGKNPNQNHNQTLRQKQKHLPLQAAPAALSRKRKRNPQTLPKKRARILNACKRQNTPHRTKKRKTRGQTK